MSVRLEDFAQAVVASGLMTADDLQVFRSNLPPGTVIKTGEDLAHQLVGHGRLTRFQARAIYRNDGRRLSTLSRCE